jgi:hypothetical protein
MTLLESTGGRTRAAGQSQAERQPNRLPGARRKQTGLENAREVATTMLVLVLIAFGIVALRYLLVLAYGFLR